MERINLAMNALILEKKLLPGLLLLFIAASIQFLQPVILNLWWIFFVSLFFLIAIKKSFVYQLDYYFILILFVYAIWCFFTTFWSDVPLLTFLKSSLFIIISLTMVQAGKVWSKTSSWEKSLDYLGATTFLALLCGIIGKFYFKEAAVNISEHTCMYQGLLNGSNMFGLTMALSFPYLLWKSYINYKHKGLFILYNLLLLSCFYFLIISMSRASILIVMMTLLFFFLTLNINRKIIVFFISANLLITINIAYPQYLEQWLVKYLYKTNDASLFYSRHDIWQQSYEAAMSSGWWGLGYGVSLGHSHFHLNSSLTTTFYGREKGCSQLAIIEEIGRVGFILYLGLLLIIMKNLYRLSVRTNNPSQKVLLGIITGFFLGMVMQSMFEAWWNSPSAPESLFFWSLVGLIRGLELNSIQEA